MGDCASRPYVWLEVYLMILNSAGVKTLVINLTAWLGRPAVPADRRQTSTDPGLCLHSSRRANAGRGRLGVARSADRGFVDRFGVAVGVEEQREHPEDAANRDADDRAKRLCICTTELISYDTSTGTTTINSRAWSWPQEHITCAMLRKSAGVTVPACVTG